MTYDYIRSNYIKNKIKGKSFSDEKFKKYIKNLMMIEDYVSGRNMGMITTSLVRGLIEGNLIGEDGKKVSFKEEYEAISDELDPDWREEQAERARKQAEERAKEEQKKMKKEMKQREKDLKEWIKLGGLP